MQSSLAADGQAFQTSTHGRGQCISDDEGICEQSAPASQIPSSPSTLNLHPGSPWHRVSDEISSSLLIADFVDVVFQVRDTPALLGAHRVLVASALPALREELRRLAVPPLDLRVGSLQWADAAAKEPLHNLSHEVASCTGVVDLSKWAWGNYSVVRALLCHIYNRPMQILDQEVQLFADAAKTLGSPELAQYCEVLERSRSPGAGKVPLVKRPAAAVSATSTFSGSGTTPSALPSRADSPQQAWAVQPHVEARDRGVDDHLPDNSPRTSPGHISPVCSCPSSERDWNARGQPKPPADTGDIRAHPMGKPRFERSFSVTEFQNFPTPGAGDKYAGETATDKPKLSDSGGVRRVLSEIKRNIVESSRIIADKTYQQMYEMVPGERGILGEGINGPVRMAKHRKTGKEVAVKRISCVNLSEQRRQMLVSEVRIFLQVSHRNIVQLLEVYESEVDQAVLLVMELCTGKELFDWLATRQWYSEFDAALIARQMLDAVSYLHSQNICHRDLKLENWLYESTAHDAKLKLCDFGFGQIVEPSVQLTATLGSLFYVAPEVLAGDYGLPCDMWSVGVIVYMLLSGVPPFDGKTDADVTAKIRQGRFVTTGKRWESISETAHHFVRSLLRKDPYERLTAAEANQHAWLKMDCQPTLVSTKNQMPDAELDLPIDRGVICDMSRFVQNNALTRAALGMLAKLNTSFGGREEDVNLLHQRFRTYDEQNTGKIDAHTFIQVLKETLHLQISSADEKHFFERIAANLLGSELEREDAQAATNEHKEHKEHKKGGRKRREVNYSEFITLAKARRMANNTATIRQAFRTLDVSGDGYIKEHDMHSLLGDEFKSTIDNYVDEQGKDCIDYEDFANIVSQEITKKEEKEVEATSAPTDVLLKESETRDCRLPSGVSCQEQGSQVSPVLASVASSHGSKVVERKGQLVRDEDLEPRTGADSPDISRRQLRREATTDEIEDEEVEDAGAQSDEEQLVNVKNTSEGDLQVLGATSSTPEADTDAEDKKAVASSTKKPAPKEKWRGREQSFSLSLAGSSEYDDKVPRGVSRVTSMPSDVYSIRQYPGFHAGTLRPFYAGRPVSNIIMGLIRGTSLYARQSVAAKLATIIHTACGWFFIMPNPKHHHEVDTKKGLLSKEMGKFRFVAWWIHPRFVAQLRQWFERLTYEGLDQDRHEQRRQARAHHEARVQAASTNESAGAEAQANAEQSHMQQPASQGQTRQAQAEAGVPESAGVSSAALQHNPGAGSQAVGGVSDMGMGGPGDFRFSDVPKPENYLNVYRDLHTKDHVNMLSQLYEGSHRFLRSIFDENFMAHAQISAGFHYPVRTQYATLHMQLRVNAGSVCGEDGRGIELQTLVENLQRDRQAYYRDEDTLRYHVSENIKVSLLAAATEYEEQHPGESASRHTSPLAFDLGLTTMPTIQDEENEEEEEEEDDTRPRADTNDEEREAMAAGDSQAAGDGQVFSYIVNLQPSPDSAFCKVLNDKRKRCGQDYGSDPTYLFPPHIPVTGFFEAQSHQVDSLSRMMSEMLVDLQGADKIQVGRVICTATGYVLYDVQATSIGKLAKRLEERSSPELGVCIRSKQVNHISLACNRPDPASREQIREIYEPTSVETGDENKQVAEACATACFDMVISHLLRRSSFERLAEDGLPHELKEVARIPVGRSQGEAIGDVNRQQMADTPSDAA